MKIRLREVEGRMLPLEHNSKLYLRGEMDLEESHYYRTAVRDGDAVLVTADDAATKSAPRAPKEK